MHRFFIPPEQIDGHQAIITDPIAHQIRNVLRMAVGQHIMVLDNSGWEYEVELAQLQRGQVIGKLVGKRPSPHEPRTHLTLYQSLMKRDKFEFVLQKATEVGVSRIVPVISQRSLVQTADSLKPNKQERWQRILTEAAEQCQRGRIPELHPPAKFSEIITQCPNYQLSLICYENGGVAVKTAVAQSPLPQTIALFIGPEGGYDPSEIQLAQQHGVTLITLGSRILRAETAALIAPALILHELESNYQLPIT